MVNSEEPVCAELMKLIMEVSIQVSTHAQSTAVDGNSLSLDEPVLSRKDKSSSMSPLRGDVGAIWRMANSHAVGHLE